MAPRKVAYRSKNSRPVSAGSKSLNGNWRGHPSDLSIAQRVPSGSASQLRTVITRSTPENRGIPCWENQVIIYSPKGDRGKDTVHVDP